MIGAAESSPAEPAVNSQSRGRTVHAKARTSSPAILTGAQTITSASVLPSPRAPAVSVAFRKKMVVVGLSTAQSAMRGLLLQVQHLRRLMQHHPALLLRCLCLVAGSRSILSLPPRAPHSPRQKLACRCAITLAGSVDSCRMDVERCCHAARTRDSVQRILTKVQAMRVLLTIHVPACLAPPATRALSVVHSQMDVAVKFPAKLPSATQPRRIPATAVKLASAFANQTSAENDVVLL